MYHIASILEQGGGKEREREAGKEGERKGKEEVGVE